MALRNLTLSIDEATLKSARKYAKSQNTTVNQMVRDFLASRFTADRGAEVEEMLRVMRAHRGNSRGWKWNREELYER